MGTRAATLEEQTTFNPAQLRRLLICNLDAVAMPDLALTGRQALEAARSYGPVVLPTIRTDLEAHREALVRLLRKWSNRPFMIGSIAT